MEALADLEAPTATDASGAPAGDDGGAFEQLAASGPVAGITTGKVTSPNLGIDWLAVTFPVGQKGQVLALLGNLGSHKEGPGMHWYRAGGLRWEDGAALCWNENGDCWLSLNGRSLSRLGDSEVHQRILGDLAKLGVKCTRLDLKADLPPDLLDLGNVGAAAAAGQVVGFRRYKHEAPVRDMRSGELEGNAHYFGRRGGDGGGKYVRFYDKTLESHGLIEANRLEAELSLERAQIVFEDLATCDGIEEFKRIISRRLAGIIDFREVNENEDDRHLERRPRLSWWQRIIDALGGATITKVLRTKPQLLDTLAYHLEAFTRTVGRLYGNAERLGWEGYSTVSAHLAVLAERGKRWWEDNADLGGPPLLETDLEALFA